MGLGRFLLPNNLQHLTTFITPNGQYCFKKLHFGISIAPEHLKNRMSQILEGLRGVLYQLDDVLVFVHSGSSSKDNSGRWSNLQQRPVRIPLQTRVKCPFFWTLKTECPYSSSLCHLQQVTHSPTSLPFCTHLLCKGELVFDLYSV